MWLHGTNETIKALKDFYTDYYREMFNEYCAELEFTTILTYYSGSCALVIDIHSTQNASAETDICIMVDCTENEMKDLSQDALHRFFSNRIMEKYKGLLELNKALCSRPIHRKIIIKNTNFNEHVLNIKLEKELLQIELNYNKIAEISRMDLDLVNSIEALGRHFDKENKRE